MVKYDSGTNKGVMMSICMLGTTVGFKKSGEMDMKPDSISNAY